MIGGPITAYVPLKSNPNNIWDKICSNCQVSSFWLNNPNTANSGGQDLRLNDDLVGVCLSLTGPYVAQLEFLLDGYISFSSDCMSVMTLVWFTTVAKLDLIVSYELIDL